MVLISNDFAVGLFYESCLYNSQNDILSASLSYQQH